MRYWVHADTFDIGDLKGKATKVLEEASEACEEATTHANPLVYGIGRNGWATFREVKSGYRNDWVTRARPASEILMCMMRAMVANSGHSEVDHPVGRGGGL